MNDQNLRTLNVEKGTVQCLSWKKESIEKCRFCVHSVSFLENGRWIKSPARAFCTKCRSTDEVSLPDVAAVLCDDRNEEGYRSIMNIIS
ncbi:MAG: hypothetical protein JXQ82_03745 [Methanomicrobiaceae archaeon]|nr:hypothetical protein [Methanomicrobiaceae archaeon]